MKTWLGYLDERGFLHALYRGVTVHCAVGSSVNWRHEFIVGQD